MSGSERMNEEEKGRKRKRDEEKGRDRNGEKIEEEKGIEEDSGWERKKE